MKDYGIGLSTVVGVVPAFIIIGLVISLGGLSLYLAGLLNAVLYLFAGVGFLWFLSLFGVFKSPWGWVIGAITVIVMPLIGWGVDNIHLALPNFGSWLASSPSITLYQNSLDGIDLSFDLTTQIFGYALTIASIVVGAVSIFMNMKRKKRR